MKKNKIEVSVVMPCLNEAETLAECIKKAQQCLRSNSVNFEIIIADNGSSDDSVKIARAHSAEVINVSHKGYGAALMGGIKAAKGEYIIMGDADDSYDFLGLMPFIEKLRNGFELVMGNRFKGGIKSGAMPFLHKYLGNPVLSFVGRLFFRIPIGDFHCGLRGFRKSSVLNLDLQTTGMEFASEMVVKSFMFGMSIAEVPTTLSKDGRSRAPHLNTWRDGWRHLRFLLMYSPKWLFLVPGLSFLLVGLLLSIVLFFGPVQVGGVEFDLNTFLLSTTMILLGYQIIMFYSFIRIYATTQGILPQSKNFMNIFKFFNLEKGLLFGFFGLLLGTIFFITAMINWYKIGFGPINDYYISRLVIAAVILITLSIQTIFGSFFLSMLGIKKQN